MLEQLFASGRGLPLWMAFQGVALALAFAWFWRRSRGSYARLRLCLLAAFAGAALGASALGVLERLPAWVRSGYQLSALGGGVVAYGALAGLTVTFVGLARRRGLAAGEAVDRLAPCLGALVICGRLGCFFGGCDFGAVSRAPWAMRYPAGSPAFADHLARGLVLATDHRSLPVHPTQAYEVLVGLAMVLCALAVERAGARRGAPFWAAAVVYAVGRLLLDELRGDHAAAAWGPWTMSQWIGAAVLVAAAQWWAPGRRRRARVSASAEAEQETSPHGLETPTGVSEMDGSRAKER